MTVEAGMPSASVSAPWLGDQILPEYDELVRSVRNRYRSVGSDKAAPLRSVAAAINQAMAQMTEHLYEDAVRTLDEVNGRLGGGNPDLLSVRARALALVPGVQPAQVRKAFEAAYDAGQRKDVFFDLWFKAEITCTSFDRAVEVADRALQSNAGTPIYWLTKRIDARRLAADRHLSGDPEHAAAQVRLAFADISRIGELVRSADEEADSLVEATAQRYVEIFADLHWRIARPLGDFARWLDAAERQLDAIVLGDERGDTYLRAAAALVGLFKSVSSSSGTTPGVVEQQLKRVLQLYRRAPHIVARDPKFKSALNDLEQLSRRGG